MAAAQTAGSSSNDAHVTLVVVVVVVFMVGMGAVVGIRKLLSRHHRTQHGQQCTHLKTVQDLMPPKDDVDSPKSVMPTIPADERSKKVFQIEARKVEAKNVEATAGPGASPSPLRVAQEWIEESIAIELNDAHDGRAGDGTCLVSFFV